MTPATRSLAVALVLAAAADAGAADPPKPRTRAEVDAVLAGAPNPPEPTRPIRVVLVAGKKDHGPGEHDYPAWQKAWSKMLAAAEKVEVATAWEWPAREEFQKADVMVFYQRGDWNPQRAADVDAFLERGGGLVYVHWAVDGREDAPGFAKRIGLASRGGKIRYRHGPLDLTFNRDAKHPIARNFDKLHLVDESYWMLTGELPPGRVIASAVEENEPRPLFWTVEHPKGRVFVSIPGHYSWTFDDPLFRVLLLRGIAWAAREPVDRFNGLVWSAESVVSAATGPKRLFDGKTLDGWEGDTEKTWRIEDGAIVGGSLDAVVPRNEFLCTKQTFGDFELRVKFKLVGDKARANAGIQFRTQRIPNHHEVIGYQADVGQDYWGALYDESRRKKVLAKPDPMLIASVVKHEDWNEYRIRCEGPRVRLWLNGKQTVDYTETDDTIDRTGVIGLQIHGGAKAKAYYKDITIEEIK